MLKNIFVLLLFLYGTDVFAQNYTYLDGSGNKYEWMADGLSYVPVTPEKSSSGEYSGGNPKKVGVSSEEVKLLKAAFEKAIKAKNEHQENREMMTGMIIRTKKKKESNFILRSDSASKKELEELLKKVMAK